MPVLLAGLLLAGIARPVLSQPPRALVAPEGQLVWEAERKVSVPEVLRVAVAVGSPSRADDNRQLIACPRLGITTRRPARFADRGTVSFVVRVVRGGEVAAELLLEAVPEAAGSELVEANVCGSLSEAPSLEVRKGDTLLLEARPSGVRRLRRGDRVTLEMTFGARSAVAPQALGVSRPVAPTPPASARLPLTLASGGTVIYGAGGTSPGNGPQTAKVGFTVPEAVEGVIACLRLFSLDFFSGWSHPATRVTAIVRIVRVGERPRRLRIHAPLRDGEIFEEACHDTSVDLEPGDFVTTKFRLRQMARSVPPQGVGSVSVELRTP